MNFNCLYRSVHVVILHSCSQHASITVQSISCLSDRRVFYQHPAIRQHDVFGCHNGTTVCHMTELLQKREWEIHQVIPSSSSEFLSRDPIEAMMGEEESTSCSVNDPQRGLFWTVSDSKMRYTWYRVPAMGSFLAKYCPSSVGDSCVVPGINA